MHNRYFSYIGKDYTDLEQRTAEIKSALEQHPRDAELWLKYGLLMVEADEIDKSIQAFSQGLYYDPMNAQLRLQKGRRFIAKGQYWACISDIALAVKIDPNIWDNWYYLSVALNLAEQYDEAAKTLERCREITLEKEHLFPVIDWMFVNLVEGGHKEEAQNLLNTFDCEIPCIQMDYSYKKRVKLFAGKIPPEEFYSIVDIEENCLKRPNRVKLEQITQLFGLAFYYAYIKIDENKRNVALKELIGIDMYHQGFGYIKGVKLAKERGILT